MSGETLRPGMRVRWGNRRGRIVSDSVIDDRTIVQWDTGAYSLPLVALLSVDTAPEPQERQ